MKELPTMIRLVVFMLLNLLAMRSHCFEIPDIARVFYVRPGGCDFGYCRSPGNTYQTCSIPTMAPSLRRRALSVSTASPTTLPSQSSLLSPSASAGDKRRRLLAPSDCNHISLKLSNDSSLVGSNFEEEIYHAQSGALVFEKNVWTTVDGRTIMFVVDRWIVIGLNNEILTHSEHNNSAQYPPAMSSDWAHSAVSGAFQVELICFDTLEPSRAPTVSPTKHPLAGEADMDKWPQCQETNVFLSEQARISLVPFTLEQDADISVKIVNMPENVVFDGHMAWWTANAPNEEPLFSFALRFADGSPVQQPPELVNSTDTVTPGESCIIEVEVEECALSSVTAVWRHLLPGNYTIVATLLIWGADWTEPVFDAHLDVRCGYLTRRPTTDPTAAPTVFEAINYEDSTCRTAEYAWKCMFGQGGVPETLDCLAAGFDGNGILDLGQEDAIAPTLMNNWAVGKQQIIRGTGTWYWAWCDGSDCSSVSTVGISGSYANAMDAYLMFDGLTMDNMYGSTAVNFTGRTGAILHFKNVIFAPTQHGYRWDLSEDSTLIVENCQFSGDSVSFLPLSFDVDQAIAGAVHIEGSLFERVQSMSDTAMFQLNDLRTFSISNCTFINNMGPLASLTTQQFLFNDDVWWYGDWVAVAITIYNSRFIGNQMNESTSFIFLGVLDWRAWRGSLTIADCTFQQNVMSGPLLGAKGGNIEIRASTFLDNKAPSDVYLEWFSRPCVCVPAWWCNMESPCVGATPSLSIYDSLFVNGSRTVHVAAGNIKDMTAVLSVQRSNWIQYEQLASNTFVDTAWSSFFDASFTACEFHNMTGSIVTRPTYFRDDFYFADCLFSSNQWGSSLFESNGGRLAFLRTTFMNNRYNESLVTLNREVPQTAHYLESMYSVWDDLDNSSLLIQDCTLGSNIKLSPMVLARSQDDVMIEIYETNIANCSSYGLEFYETSLITDRQSIQSPDGLLFDFPAILYLWQFEADASNIDYIQNGINFTGLDSATVGVDAYVAFEPCTSYTPFETFVADETNFDGQFLYDEVGELSEDSWSCTATDTINTGGCHIKCNAKLSCVLSELSITSSDAAANTIRCDGVRSCWDSTMHIQSTSNATILCIEENACKDSSVTLTDLGEASIMCLKASSCGSLVVRIFNVSKVSITCYQPHACDNIHITSDSDRVDLYMLNHNANVQLTVPNEFRSDRLHCDEDAYLNLDSDTYLNLSADMIEQQVIASYGVVGLPCDGINYFFSESGRASCVTEYQFDGLPAFSYFPEFLRCLPYPTSFTYQVHCIGTWSPTTDPTKQPSLEPTIEPTADPTLDPTVDPTSDPTTDPTFDPTSDPTFDPTADPTSDPTADPTSDPTTDPTNYPTINPTMEPTNEPTSDPTLDPTLNPTTMPTREPTELDEYDSYFSVKYVIVNWTLSAIEQFAGNMSLAMSALTTMIETGYEQHLDVLHYHDFWLQLERLNGLSLTQAVREWSVERAEIELVRSKARIAMEGKVLCSELKCDYIVKDYDKAQFESLVTAQVQAYFGGEIALPSVSASASDTKTDALPLQFEVVSQSEEAMSLYAEQSRGPVNYGFFVALGVSCILVLIALCSGCYNTKYWILEPFWGCKRVDDGKYFALIAFALHLYDFSSDINLAVEICFNLIGNAYTNTLLLCAVGSVAFIVIPYSINLYYACKVQQMIASNESAKSWFFYHSKIFTALVVLSGGCYASLHLVSSNLFGLAMLSSGLTQYELRNKKVANMRFIGNVLCENVPQLIIQAMYAAYIGIVNEPLMFAFVASLLSVINHSLGYCVDRRARDQEKDVVVVHYYLIVRCDKRMTRLPANAAFEEEEEEVVGATVQTTANVNGSPVSRVNLTKLERRSIKNNMGRRHKLISALAELFGIESEYICIASTTLTTQGFISHIVQCVSMLEIVSTTQRHYIDDLYKSVQSEVDDLFQTHFDLSPDFKVQCQHQLNMMNRMNYVGPDVGAVDDLQSGYVDTLGIEEEEDRDGAQHLEMTAATGDVEKN